MQCFKMNHTRKKHKSTNQTSGADGCIRPVAWLACPANGRWTDTRPAAPKRFDRFRSQGQTGDWIPVSVRNSWPDGLPGHEPHWLLANKAKRRIPSNASIWNVGTALELSGKAALLCYTLVSSVSTWAGMQACNSLCGVSALSRGGADRPPQTQLRSGCFGLPVISCHRWLRNSVLQSMFR